MLDPARLVFIDETAVSTNLARLRGRAPRGIRVIGHAPLGTWKTITFVAALRHYKIVAPMVVEGAMNWRNVPGLRSGVPGSDVTARRYCCMNNLQAHKVAGIQEAITSRRATLRYLPKSRLTLTPSSWSTANFKALLRKVAARTVPALVRTMRSFVPLFGTQECTRYLRHAGYASV
jgi:DDE superfamily endonuclease